MRRRSLGIFLAVALALSGCAEKAVTVNPHYDFSKIRRIAVLGFEPVDGEPTSSSGVAAVFEKLLIDAGYELVERQRVDAVVHEQQFQISGAVNPEQAVKLGKLLGVDALVFGTITVYTPAQSSVVMVDIHSDTREPVVRKKRIEIEKDGKKSWEDVDIVVDYLVTHEVRQQPQIYRIQAEAGAVVKMVDAQTGEIAWVGSATEEGANIQSASEMVGHRIVNGLKKFWPTLQKV